MAAGRVTLTLLLLWLCPLTGAAINETPIAHTIGVSLLRVTLPYQSLRSASAMMTTFKPALVQICSF